MFEILAATVLLTWPLFLTVQFHGTLVGCQGKLTVGTCGMWYQESFEQIFWNCKFMLKSRTAAVARYI